MSSLRESTTLRTIGILFIVLLTTILYLSYFNESIFYMNTEKYKQKIADENVVYYENSRGFSVEVQINGQNRKVVIDQKTYDVERQENQYELIYPNGKIYLVNDRNGHLISFDENDELVSSVSVYVDGKRDMRPGEELYHPSSIVRAAYAEYHSKQGNGFFYIASILLFVYGWCGFRYEAFQNVMFKISPQNLYVQDAEPSDFYYFMCKVGGIATMLIAVYLFMKSFAG